MDGLVVAKTKDTGLLHIMKDFPRIPTVWVQVWCFFNW